jgi:hypothetical protein
MGLLGSESVRARFISLLGLLKLVRPHNCCPNYEG